MKNYFLVAFFALSLSACTTPQDRQYQQFLQRDAARKQLIARDLPLTPTVTASREQLIADLKSLLIELYPSYNQIYVSFAPGPDGNAWGGLRATHPLFSDYEFAAGPSGPSIQAWVNARQSEFVVAHISYVVLGYSYDKNKVDTGWLPPRSE